MVDDNGAEARFWQEIEQAGAPLVEASGGDYLTTFLWRGEGRTTSVLVMSSLTFANEPRELMMERLSGTDVWYRTYKFPPGTAIVYELSPDSSGKASNGDPPADFASRFRRDPLNQQNLTGPMGGSYVVLPGSDGHRWSDEAADIPIETVSIKSAALNDKKKIMIYRPESPSMDRCWNLLVMFDGEWAVEQMRTPLILRRLLGANEIPPTAAIFVMQENRSAELLGNEDFVRFVAKDVVGWARRALPICEDRGSAIVGGASAGGLAAALTVLRHPDTFGGALMLSSSLRWAPPGDTEPEWMARQWSTVERSDVRIALSVGRHETVVPQGDNQVSLVVANRHFRDVLRARGADVRMVLYEGAHEPLSWRGAIPDALRWLSNTR